MRWISLLLPAFMLLACQQHNPENERAALTLAPESLSQRQQQARRFDTGDQLMILSATSGVLQDLGFIIEETSSKSGLIVGSKSRRANDGWLVNYQNIRVSIVTKPSADGKAVIVRVNFQRVVVSAPNPRAETIDDPIIYQQFFNKLAQALFLEAHEI